MKINKQDKKGNVVTIEIEEEYSELKPHSEAAYKEASRELKIPGFRKGKVPPNIMKTYISEDAVLEKAIQKLISNLYPDLIDQTKIEPVDYPKIDIVKFEKEKPIVLKIDIEVYPEVKIGNYKSVKVEKPSEEVTDKELNDTIENIRKSLATTIKVSDRPVKEKDVVALDIQAKCDGKVVPQLSRKDVRMEVGSAQISFEFDEALHGINIGDTKEFTLTMPEQFYVNDVAGKKVDYHVTINDISEKNLPPLDDSFAKTITQSSSVEEMKKELKDQIGKDKKNYSEQQVRDSAIEKTIEFVEADIPKAMIDREIDLMIDDFDKRLKRNGSTLDVYLKSVKKDIDGIKEEVKEGAEKRVKGQLLIRKIMEDEKIKALDEDINMEMEEISKASNKNVEDFKKEIGQEGLEAIKNMVLRKKSVDHIISKIKIEIKGA